MTSGDRLTEGPFAGLRRNGYQTILADPPWLFKTFSPKGEGKSPQMHYPCMTMDDILALPVADLAARNCVLIMWGISPLWHRMAEVMSAWGFEPKTKGGWAKQSTTGEKWAFGTGHILRGAHEDIYLGTRGAPRYQSKSVRNLLVAPLRDHSRKPDEQYEMWEALCGLGPRLELFARQRWPGWEAWGNETGKFSAPDDLTWHLRDFMAAARRLSSVLT